MIITNEPGFYKEDSYGIRIENILHVIHSHKHSNFLAFENLTMVPYCRELIDESLLVDHHKAEIAAYYETIASRVRPLLEKEKDVLALDYLSEQLDI